MGCLSERYMDELREEIPEVDKFYGKFNWKELINDLEAEDNEPSTPICGEAARVTTTPKHYAYIKYRKGATGTAPIAPFLSLPANTRAARWRTY